MVRVVTLVRRRHHQYWPHWVALAWLTVAVFALLMVAGCRRRVAVPDAAVGPAQPTTAATISGTVRAPEGATGIEDRVVEVINVDTSERQRVTTNNAGSFVVKVKPGKYRVELTLRDGEAIVRQPGVINVNRTDFDAHADLVIGSGRGSGRVPRPRGPAYRIDNGLGSPIA